MEQAGRLAKGTQPICSEPALARGELRTIAATTWAEYKKYFEKDAALARRFQVVKVEEPSESVAIEMVRGLTKTLEKHHKVHILEEAIIDAVKLSSRYISGRQLPDKAISLIDTACARINLSQSSTPPALEDAQRELAQLKLACEILQRESLTGSDHTARLAEIEDQIKVVELRLKDLKERWDGERAIVTEVHDLTAKLHGLQPAAEATAPADGGKSPPVPAAPSPPATPEQIAQWKTQLKERKQALQTLQGETPLVHPFVDRNAVAETVAAWTGIPVGRMVADEINTSAQLA